MSIRPGALSILIVNGLVIGSLYAGMLILAFRYLGRWGGAGLAALALTLWSAAFLTDASGRFHGAAVSLRLAMAVLIVALSVVPPLAIDRVRRRPGGTYIRQAVHGIASFYLAIVGSLAIGLIVYLTGKRGSW
jgi:hypothetical protein